MHCKTPQIESDARVRDEVRFENETKIKENAAVRYQGNIQQTNVSMTIEYHVVRRCAVNNSIF